jgi:plastocyanin
VIIAPKAPPAGGGAARGGANAAMPGWERTGRAALALAATLCVAVAAGACGGSPPAEPLDPPPLESPVDPTTAGTIAGTIRFDGTPPPAEAISMRTDPYCLRANPDATLQTVLVNDAGGLANVFVHVTGGLEGLRFPVPAEPAVLDQRGCMYEPRVFGMQVGQTLEIRNSDDTLHNIHAQASVNREFNKGQARQGQRDTHVFSAREVLLPFKCDVHRWMNAWVGIVDHPFHAVTGPDGSFRLEGLPPGSYTIEAWHETLGTQSHTVTLGPSDTRDLAMVFAGE